MRPHILALGYVLLLVGCHKKDEAAEKHAAEEAKDPTRAPLKGSDAALHTDEPEHEDLAKHVRLKPNVAREAGIQFQPVTREVLTVPLELPGELSADPDRSAQVSARITGRLERIAFREGQTVKAGELLAVVRAPELGDVASSFSSLKARGAAARSNAGRLDVLLRSGLASEQETLAAKAEADAFEAEARAAGERLRTLGAGQAAQSRLELRAPIGGTVVTRTAIVGQPVTPDQTIASIVDLREVWFLGRVFEQNLARIHVGAHAEVQLNGYPNEVFAGSVDYIAPRIDPTARTVVARVRLTNKGDRLRLGLFGTARVDSGEGGDAGAPALVVPRSAVTEIGKKAYVFVHQPDDDFDLHEVILGRAGVGKVEVVSGLREGEQVVFEGVFTLKSAALRSSFAEEEE